MHIHVWIIYRYNGQAFFGFSSLMKENHEINRVEPVFLWEKPCILVGNFTGIKLQCRQDPYPFYYTDFVCWNF
jgi:hypothetical protein